MKKKKKVFLIVLILLVLIFAAIMIYENCFGEYVTRSYEENNEELLNPERGLYVQNFTQDYKVLSRNYSEENFRVVLLTYDLSGFENKKYLTEEKLEELDKALNLASELGMGIVFRAGYDFVGNYTDPDDFQYVLNHVEQIGEIINKYPETIMAVQAGFIGPFGEWHSSKYNDDENGNSYKEMLLKKLIEVLDEDIVINLRRPVFIREALSYNLPVERFGLHNDALLSSNTDYGTYSDDEYSREDELNWLSENITTPMNGGETICVSEYSNIDNAVKEFNQMQITYLNRYYNEEVLDYWSEQTYDGQNGYDYIVNHLGYRLSLKSVSLIKEVGLLQSIQVNGKIRNSGFAKPNDDYIGYLVLNTEKETIYIKLNQNFSNKEEMSFSMKKNIPFEYYKFEDGASLKIGILMTDRLQTIPNEAYCIQFANNEINYSKGVNYFAEYIYNANSHKFELNK